LDGLLPAVDALVVDDGEDLLIERQSAQRRLGDVHGAHAFLAASVVNRLQPVGIVRRHVGGRVRRRQDAGS